MNKLYSENLSYCTSCKHNKTEIICKQILRDPYEFILIISIKIGENITNNVYFYAFLVTFTYMLLFYVLLSIILN